jgi:hypothetical protein
MSSLRHKYAQRPLGGMGDPTQRERYSCLHDKATTARQCCPNIVRIVTMGRILKKRNHRTAVNRIPYATYESLL